ncbi:cupin domain-containing protein [Glutamicibacter sp. NPDC087344]|uniref:cupin domain-containing protein n=1 Tax=Glutamicibacter sp. NPDC087344 TaxID=3363994 RepID=UPI0037F8E6F6
MSENSPVFESGDNTRSVDALSTDLAHEPVPAEQSVSGDPTTAVQSLGEIFGTEFGLWEMSAGTMRDVEAEELFIVLSGSGKVTIHAVNGFEEEVVNLVPGSICHLREGMNTTWVLEEPLRKVYLAK